MHSSHFPAAPAVRILGPFCCLVAAGLAHAQVETLRAELENIGTLPGAGTVVATVNGQPIEAADVNKLLAARLRGQPVAREQLDKLEAEMLDQVIDLKLVELFLDSQKIDVTDAEHDASLTKLTEQLAAQKVPLEAYLGERGMTPAGFRKQSRIAMRTQKLAAMRLNDAELEKFFEAHRPEFDGRELRVSHILFRPSGPLDSAGNDALVKKAEQLRADIAAGKISFADAAAKYSAGPSRRNGGDLGFIPRRGVMDEQFADAAFKLEKGQVSEPIKTTFGVHLIQWTDMKPGKLTWQQARKLLEPAAFQALLKQAAETMRAQAKIEFTGELAHYEPGTKNVVPATRTARKDDKKESATAETKPETPAEPKTEVPEEKPADESMEKPETPQS